MQTKSLGIILVLGAALRFGLLAAGAVHGSENLFTPDTAGYVELAQSLARDGTFERDAQPELFRTPGYPILLLFGSIFGPYWAFSVAAAQVFLDILLVYLTYLLASLLCGRRAAIWAALFQAVSPLAVAASCRILTDAPFALLWTLSLLLAAHHFRSGAWWSLLSAAAVAGAACYLRPAGILYAGALGVVLLFRARRFARAAAFAAVIGAMLAPWVIRNAVVADYWGFSNLPDDVAFGYQAPAVLAALDGTNLEVGRREMEQRLARELPPGPISAGELSRRKGDLSRRVVREHPWTYLKLHLRGDLAVWMPAATDVAEIAGLTSGNRGTMEVLHAQGPLAAARHYFGGRTWALWLCAPLVLLAAVKLLLALAGAVRIARAGPQAVHWAMALAILVASLIPGPAGHPRFRVPVEPLLSLLAGVAVAAMLDRRARRQACPTITTD